MDSKNISIVWAGVLMVVALLVSINVNFGFKEEVLKRELMEHTAFRTRNENICVCPSCGKTGLAYCAHCGMPMRWDRARGKFLCSPCNEAGNPKCPRCMTLMRGVRGARRKPVHRGTGQPIPIF